MSRCDCNECKDIREQYYQRHPNGCLMETPHDTVIREAAEVLYWGKHKEEEQRKEKWAEVGPKLLLALKWQHGCMTEIAEGRGVINFETGSEMIRRLREAIREAESI